MRRIHHEHPTTFVCFHHHLKKTFFYPYGTILCFASDMKDSSTAQFMIDDLDKDVARI